jgi:hypothetical protein
MRFLQPRWSPQLLAISAIGLCLNSLPLRADDTLNRVVVEADDVDVAKIQFGGQIAFASSGQRTAVSHAIDDDRRTVFLFSSSDPRPTLIVKLNDSKPIHRVCVVAGSQSEKVDIYLLDKVPNDPSELDKTKPVTSIVDLGVARDAVADFAPRTARYVALRWTLAKNAPGPLAVAEVSVFSNAVSDPNQATLAAADPPPPEAVQGPPLIASVSP